MISQTKNDEKPLMLVFPFGLLAHYLRCLVLCRELRHYFRIKFVDHRDYNSFVRQEGFDTVDCISLDPEKAIEGVKNFDLTWLKQDELERLFHAQVKVIKENSASVVLGDYTPTLKMAAEKTGTPYFSLMNGYMSKYYAGSRQISKSHPAYRLIKYLPAGLARTLTRYGESIAFQKLHQPFKQIRKKYSLEVCAGYLDELEGDINLLCDLPELFPQAKLPGSYHVIGPLYFDSGSDSNSHQLPDDQSRKSIMVTMGSSGDWSKLTFLNREDFQAYNILAIGDKYRLLHGPHIKHLPFVGMHEFFPAIDLMICHGGNGTLYQALYYGIPTLVSTNHCEQEWNLAAFGAVGLANEVYNVNDQSQICRMIESFPAKGERKQINQLMQSMRSWETKMPGVIHKVLQGYMKGQAKTRFVISEQ